MTDAAHALEQSGMAKRLEVLLILVTLVFHAVKNFTTRRWSCYMERY